MGERCDIGKDDNMESCIQKMMEGDLLNFVQEN